MSSTAKLARVKYNKTAYEKNKDKHNEICRKYYVLNSEILRQKRIERYNIQKKQKQESPEYKLQLEAKKEAKKQKLLKQLQELEAK
jgi:hypothetical protein